MLASIVTAEEELARVQQALADHRHQFNAFLKQLKELKSSEKAAHDEHSQHLASHQAELLVEPPTDKELTAKALKEAKRVLVSGGCC